MEKMDKMLNTGCCLEPYFNLDFVKRGILFYTNVYNDECCHVVLKILRDDNICFVFDNRQWETVKLIQDNEMFCISINDTIPQFGPEGRHGLLIASAYAMLLQHAGNLSLNEIEKRFYRIIYEYKKEFGMDDVLDHNIYKYRNFKITSDAMWCYFA
ncbi:MAG: hypothetical protein LBD48_07955 [Treponema sp.]|nr:hypothetical protein [Treponema sp.]